ncbi:AI-2E family transporter [Paludisphaera soli]|uniref:AI-2E family transporter n=1 Tax=Paludisphaera soli TaxID=2712865 RepID=UPI0013EA8E5D|nr:AI-2E family transporter [Paludisphaera soli]
MNLDVATTRLLRMILIGGTIIIAMSLAAEVLKPVALAILVTFLLAPAVTRLERLGLPRIASVAAVLIFMIVAVGGVGYVVGQQFAELSKEIPVYQKNIKEKLTGLKPGEESSLDRMFGAVAELEESFATDEERTAQPVRIVGGNDLWHEIHTYLGPFESIIALVGIVLLLVVFLLFEREDVGNRILQLVGSGQIGVTTKTLAQIGQGLSSYLTALALVNVGFGTAIGLGAWAIGLPSPALWGFLSALFRFVPYVGTMISFVFPFTIAIANSPGWGQPLMVLALFAACEVVVNSIEPLLYGKSTGISPIGLLVAAMFWAWLWGPLGLLLANALTVCLAVAGKSIPGLSFLGTLLRHDVEVADDMRWYQRVLSHDLDGSLQLLDDAVKDRSFEEVCDRILIPTLSRAEHDRNHDFVDNRDVAFIWKVVRDWLDDVAERDDVTMTAAAPTATVAGPVPIPNPAPSSTPEKAPRSPRALAREARRRLLAKFRPVGQPAVSAAPILDVDPLPSLGALDLTVRPIVGLATGGGADSLVLRMLNMLLQPSGVRVHILSAGGSSLQVTDKVAQLDPALILISHLPPVGLTRARYLTKRMRARHADTPVVFGYWDVEAETPKVVESLKPASASRVVLSLASARALILNRAPSPSEAGALAEVGRN